MARKARNKQPSPAPVPKQAPAAVPAAVRPWIVVATSALVLGVVAFLDSITPGFSFLYFYMAPVALATWLAGRRTGIVFCVLSTATSLAIELERHGSFGQATWNAGIGLAVFLTVAFLLHRLRGHGSDHRGLVRWAPRICLSAAVCACLLGGVAALAHLGKGPGAGLPGPEASAILAKMATDVDQCMRVSRPVLLGSRDPAGPSCIQIVLPGDVTSLGNAPGGVGDLDGGPGTKMGWVFMGLGSPPRKSPNEDFVWHQGRLKTLLENMAAGNDEPRRVSEELARDANDFSHRLEACTKFPAGFSPAKFSEKSDWPSYCLTSLNEAAAAKDLPAAKRWAAEFASAMLSLADLHRWLEFLVENHLTALEFQAKCESLFTWATPKLANYDAKMKISAFPAGMLTLHGQSNYLEVERQAEQLFGVPPDQLAAATSGRNFSAASVWMTPRLREVFGKLGEKLSPANRRTWEQAARTPYEHAYLVNMLFRATRGNMVDQLAGVLGKLSANKPNATIQELMSVLMYRGHSFGGLEWADRFQPQLMQAAADLRGGDVEAFQQAYQFTYGFFRAATYGVTVTLRQAFEQRRMDCIRATDMLGDIYRNSGRARMGHVRWSAGTNAHSVAAITTIEGGQRKVLMLDGMSPMDKPEAWPDAYLRGHAWPPGLESSDPPYCMELYARGLDNYIWAEGYIVRDDNAGTLMKAAVPYLPAHEKTTTEKLATEPGTQP